MDNIANQKNQNVQEMDFWDRKYFTCFCASKTFYATITTNNKLLEHFFRNING